MMALFHRSLVTADVRRRGIVLRIFLTAVTLWCPADNLLAEQGGDHDSTVASGDDLKIRAERDDLWEKANLFQMAGKLAEAARTGEEVLAIEQRWLGEDDETLVASQEWLAEVYENAENLDAAEKKRTSVLAWREKHRGHQHWETIDARWALENVALLRTLTSAQRRRLQQAQDDIEGSHWLGVAASYAEAMRGAEQALAIRHQILGNNHPDTAECLHSLAGHYEALGDYRRALPLLEQALEIWKQTLGENHPDTAACLISLAEFHQTQGDYLRALPLFEQAVAIYRRTVGENDHDTAETLLKLAELHREMGYYARALPLCKQVLAITKENTEEQSILRAYCQYVLATIYLSQGDFDRAQPLYEHALAIGKQELGENHPIIATCLNNLGNLYLSHGRHEQALPLCERALRSTTQHVEATALALTERQQLAHRCSLQQHLDSYLSCLLLFEDRDETAFRVVLRWKGSTLMRQRAARLVADSPELAPLFMELQTVVRQWTAMVRRDSDDLWLKKYGKPFSARALALRANHRFQLTNLSERKEKLEAELSRRSGRHRNVSDQVTLEDLRAALPEDAALVDYLEFWHSRPSMGRKGQLDRRRSLVAFVVRSSGNVEMFNLGPIEPINEAIDTWRGAEGHETFGLLPEAQAAGQLLRDRLFEPLEAAISDAKLVLVSPDGALGRLPLAALPGRNPGTYLLEDYRYAVEPVPQLIPAVLNASNRKDLAKELLLLGGVDYDHRPQDARRSDAVAAPSPARPWQRRATDPLAQRAIADDKMWPFLRGSDSEVAFIKDLYQRAMKLPSGTDRVAELRGQTATEERFRALAPQCYILHLSTHGFFAAPHKKSALIMTAANGRSPRGNPFGDRLEVVRGYSPGLLSGLVLAGANNPPVLPRTLPELTMVSDDGYLTADEIAFLPLNNAQLVVLSACETGLGEVAGGEGLLGIQRAFQIAGARTTIATLWKVNDEATRRIMEEFYRNYLEKQLTPLDALREAQLWALNNPDLVPRGADDPPNNTASGRLPPKFWAAFTLSGDWR